MGNMQAELETLNQQRCSPGSWHSVGLAKALRFVKALLVWQKRSLQQSHFRGRKHISFLDSKKWSSPVVLFQDRALERHRPNQRKKSPVALKACCSNKTQLWSTCVIRRASCLEQLGLPRTTAFPFGQSHSEAVFNFYFDSRRDQKRTRQIHTLARVATLFLGLRHDT